MKLRKIIALVSCICLINSFSLSKVQAKSDFSHHKTDKTDELATDKLVKFLEKEKAKLRNEGLKEMNENIRNSNCREDKEKIKEIKRKHTKQINEKVAELLLNNGFELVEDKNNNTLDVSSARSSSNGIQLSDSLYYNSSSQLYDFEASWDFTDWDTLPDIEDFCAVRMTNTSGYYIHSSYCSTYAANFLTYWSNITGYTQSGVCSNGVSSPTSRVTKKFQDVSGVVYNIIDGYDKPFSAGAYYTDIGYVSHFIKKTTGGTNWIFLDYNHNYKYWSWNGSAKVSLVKLDSITHALDVNYSQSNGTWQRCSPGKMIQ